MNLLFETEINNPLTVLDIVNRTDNENKWNFCWNSIKKDYNNKIKYGIIIEFCLRAIRIYKPQYLKDEEKYIENAFKLYQYPNSIINI